MVIHTIICEPYHSNAYIIADDTGETAIIVDPGEIDGTKVHDYLAANHLKTEYILLTHEHFDHVAGLNFLRDRPDCKVVASSECSEAITDPKKNMSFFYNMPFTCRPADIRLEGQDQYLDWNGTKIRAMKTPGHSRGSACFSFANILFTGDTIIKDVRTPANLPGGDKKALAASFEFLVSGFSGNTLVYPGHGTAFSLNEVNRKMILG